MLMKVSGIIMKTDIMWRDFKKYSFESFQRYTKTLKSPNFDSEWSCTYTGGKKTGYFSRSQEQK